MKRLIFCSILATTLLFSACSTDLDVVGDYKETMVIYGLLDQAQDTQYVKINKAFLGAGDAYTYAQIKDSTQFVNALTVELRRIKNGVQVGPTIPLFPNSTKPKDTGIFYAPDQANAIYSFSTVDYPLFTDSQYELTVTNSETGTVAKATTSLITDISGFTNPVSSGTTFSFVATGSVAIPNYPFNILWTSAKDARLYQVILRLHYTDSTVTGGNIAKTLDYTLPVIKTDNINGGLNLAIYMKGRDFIKYIGNNLSDYSGLVRRKAGNVDLLLIAGSDELSNFMDVNTPSTGIIQERPEYSNISNGMGLFSARLNRAPVSRPMDGTTIDTLACGQFTKNLKFLNSLNQVNGSGGPIICP